MKVVAFNGSPRKDGNTTILINMFSVNLKERVLQPNWCSFRISPSMAASPVKNVLKTGINIVL